MTTLTAKTTRVNVYKTDVVLLIGNYAKVGPWLKRKLKPHAWEYIKDVIPDKEPSVEGRTFHLMGGGSVIWMGKKNNSVLVHELFHAAHRMLESRSIDLNEDTGEVYAYLLEHLYNELA